MKKLITMALGGMLMAIGIFALKANVQMDYTADVLAGTTPASIMKAACTDPVNTAYTADMAATVTWTIAANASPVSSVALALTAPINGDANPVATSASNVTGGPAGFLAYTFTAPKHKLDGLHCQAVSQSTLKMNGDGVDNTKFDIAVSNLADTDLGYTAADKVDAVASATPVMIFGTAGQIAAAGITDVNDLGLKDDGQVEFGGGIEANGGYEIHTVVDVTNYDVVNTTDLETVTLTFTAS